MRNLCLENSVDCVALRQNSPDRDFGTKSNKTNQNLCNLDKLLSMITMDSLAIILLDWHVIIDKIEKSYQGHFVPIIGYDQDNVYVHNQDNNNPQEFVKIKKSLSSRGTFGLRKPLVFEVLKNS